MEVAGANRRWRLQFRYRGSRRKSAVAQLFSLGHITHHKNMKTKIILPVALLTIIAILGGLLASEIAFRNRALKNKTEFETAVFVQLYQNLDRGETDAAKKRLGALVAVTSDVYEQHFGTRTDASFAPMLSQADAIKSQIQTSR